MKKIISFVLLAGLTAFYANKSICQTTKIYTYNNVTFNKGDIKSSHGGKQKHTITLIYDKDNKLIKITDQTDKANTATYIIDEILPPGSIYDLDVKGHNKKQPNMIFEFTHKSKGFFAEQFVITAKDKDGYSVDDDGSTSNVQICTNK